MACDMVKVHIYQLQIDVLPLNIGPGHKMAIALKDLASAIDGKTVTEDMYREPFIFPRSLYIWIANTNWKRLARLEGIRPEDLYRQL